MVANTRSRQHYRVTLDVEPGLVVHVDIVVVQEHPRISCAQARVRSLVRMRWQACARMGARVCTRISKEMCVRTSACGVCRRPVPFWVLHDLVMGTV